jgi:phospholipid/cholesterol/gamma-HCH transport system substrate-binding protein
LLNSAPELLTRVSTLTERLTELLADRNQQSIAGILDNVEAISRSLAERSPEIAATLADARIAIRRQAMRPRSSIGLPSLRTGWSTRKAGPLVNDLRHTIASRDQPRECECAARRSAAGRAGAHQADHPRSRPACPRPARDQRLAARVTQRVEREGALSILGGQKLPEYNPKKR